MAGIQPHFTVAETEVQQGYVFCHLANAKQSSEFRTQVSLTPNPNLVQTGVDVRLG